MGLVECYLGDFTGELRVFFAQIQHEQMVVGTAADDVVASFTEGIGPPTLKSEQYLPMTKGSEGNETEPADGGYVPPTPCSADGEPEYAIRGPLTSLS